MRLWLRRVFHMRLWLRRVFHMRLWLRRVFHMRLWLRRLFHLRPIPGQPGISARQADWLMRSAVPTEADEEVRLRDEEG